MTMVEHRHPVETGLCAAEDAIVQLGDADLAGLNDESLEQAMATGERLAARQAELSLRMLAEADDRDLGRRSGAASTLAWVRHRFRLRPGAAKSRLDLAHRIRGGPDDRPLDWGSNVATSRTAGAMPATGAALAQGSISVDHAQVIAAVMRRIPGHIEADRVTAAEADLARWATKFDPAGLARLGEHLLHVLDTDTLEDDEQHRVANRELRFNDHTGRLTGRLDNEGLALLRTALDPLAAPNPADDGTPDPRSPARRNADALIELARRACDTGNTLPSSRGTRPHLSITASLDTLQHHNEHGCDGHNGSDGHDGCGGNASSDEHADGSGAHTSCDESNRRDGHNGRGDDHCGGRSGVNPGELAWGGPISAEAVRRIACDAGITRIITGPGSLPLDVGREHRTVTPAQFAALVIRDGGCAFPGVRHEALCYRTEVRDLRRSFVAARG